LDEELEEEEFAEEELEAALEEECEVDPVFEDKAEEEARLSEEGTLTQPKQKRAARATRDFF
jgi:hypothetical protein